MKASKSDPKGFTLLEVAVALAILAVAFTALTTLQANTLVLTAEDQRMTIQTLLARDVLTRIRTGSLSLEESQGDFGEAYPDWKWALHLEQDLSIPLLSVEIRILPVQEEGKDRSASFWVLLRPKESP